MRGPLPIRRLTAIYIDVPALRPGTAGAAAFAIVCAAAATVLRMAVHPYVGVPYITFFPAVMIASLVSGLGAGLLCTALCVIAALFFFLPPPLSLEVENPAVLPDFVLFALTLLLETVVASGMRLALESYRDLSGNLEQLVEERTADVVARSRELDGAIRQLRQANEELVAAYDQGLFAARLDPNGRVVDANRAFVEGCGFARADVIGRPFWECGWWSRSPEIQERVRKAYERAARGESFRGETRYFLRDGTERVTDLSLIPIKDDAGRVVFISVPGMDITERAQQFRATFENAGVGIAHLSPDVRWIRVNHTFARIVGHPAAELAGRSVQDITYPDDLDVSLAQVERLRSGKADSYEMEKRYVRKDGTPVWVHLTGTAVRRIDGSIDHFVTVAQDISARKHAEEQVHLLMREMNHRAKNLMTLVQAIAHQTATRDPEHFIARFTERLRALAANQDLLVRNDWHGVDLEDLVRAQLAHFADCLESRISLRGPRLRLNAAAAQAIGLALHELATNAGKYGALSTDAGHVDISWGIDGEFFTTQWTERDGPRVRPPERRGFGTLVLDSMARQSIDGEVRLDFPPSGLVWRLTCPARKAIESTVAAHAAGAPVQSCSESAGGRSDEGTTGRVGAAPRPVTNP